MKYDFNPIGIISSSFVEKFGVPKQSLMITSATGILKLTPNPDFRAAMNRLAVFSHIWIVFVFHKHSGLGWRPTIRPPRLDAPRRVGVFASRSPHRPNPIGLSAVKLDRIDLDAAGGIELHLSGVDFLDQTPVLDIKPYLPFADCLPNANGGWANNVEEKFDVIFSDAAKLALQSFGPNSIQLTTLILEMLQWDPRPISQRRAMPIKDPEQEDRSFGFRIQNYEIQWKIKNQAIYVEDVFRL